PLHDGKRGVVGRFTPTRVGKTDGRALSPKWTPVHPHACGENAHPSRKGVCGCRFTPTRVGKTRSYSAPADCSTGSPPRVWGKRARPGRGSLVQRFTPTRVGKTCLVF